MTEDRERREFRRESFACVRDWVHFCVEFDLKICRGCRGRSRISIGAPEDWRCRECVEHGARTVVPLHPDLWRALGRGASTETCCPVCHEVVSIRDCWISPDARRLYCAAHLRPIATEDRYRRAALTIEGWRKKESVLSGGGPAVPSGRPRRPATTRVSPPGGPALARAQLAAHFLGDRCARCPHNGRAIYDRGRLVEIDGDRRQCTSTPDALNCADIDH